jgi:hypothetical protein
VVLQLSGPINTVPNLAVGDLEGSAFFTTKSGGTGMGLCVVRLRPEAIQRTAGPSTSSALGSKNEPAQIGVRAPSINGSVAALRFFFTVTLDRPEMARHLTFVREPRRIPVILSLEEIARLLDLQA